jgi:hypothetical protein
MKLDFWAGYNPMDLRITSKHALWLAYTGRADEAVQSLDNFHVAEEKRFSRGQLFSLNRTGENATPFPHALDVHQLDGLIIGAVRAITLDPE